MLGWREDRMNVPPAPLPVALGSHISGNVRAHSWRRWRREVLLCWFICSVIELHTGAHPQIKSLSHHCLIPQAFLMSPLVRTKHNQQMPCLFPLLLKTWITYTCGHVPHFSCSHDLAGGTGHLFPPIANFRAFSPTVKDSEVTNHFTHYPPLSQPFMYVLQILQPCWYLRHIFDSLEM